MVKTGRNEKCPCGSGVKYKRCCLETGVFEPCVYGEEEDCFFDVLEDGFRVEVSEGYEAAAYGGLEKEVYDLIMEEDKRLFFEGSLEDARGTLLYGHLCELKSQDYVEEYLRGRGADLVCTCKKEG